MSRSRPGVRDVFLHPDTGPPGNLSRTHRMIWAKTVATDAILVPIGSPVGEFPLVEVHELPPGVLSKTSCLVLDLVKLEPAQALAAAILNGSRPHRGTCLEKVLAALGHPLVPPFVKRLLPATPGAPPRRPTLPPI